MKRSFSLCAETSLLSLIVACVISAASAQAIDPQDTIATSQANGVDGRWTYRSFRSVPDMTVDPGNLLFGQGTLDLAVSSTGDLSGTIGGSGWQLTLQGTMTGSSPKTIRFQGKGTINGEEWIYDYLGYAVPKWPNGVDQRPAIVGSIVRTAPHSGGKATAGYVAQWIAVRQDSSPESAAPAPADSSSDSELRQLENDWASAVSTNDPNQIGRFFPEKFLFVGAGGVLQNRDEHLEDFRSGRLKIASVSVEDFTAEGYEGFAVANTLVTVKGTFGDRDISGKYRFMDTLRKRNNSWHAVARQQTRVANATPSVTGPGGSVGESVRAIPEPVDKTPSKSLEPRRKDLPSERILKQKYLEEDPLPNARSGSSFSRPRMLSAAASVTAGVFSAPLELTSSGGRLDVTLDVDYGTAAIGNDDVHLRMYNQRLVGPTLRVKAGDVLYITLNNRLPAETTTTHSVNGHHGWNTTNLHFHGLHVAPQGPPGVPDAESDNVLLEVPPSAPFDPSVSSKKYRVEIPADHVAGTFWYHAHKHGSTTAQVSSGMAGALIIERNDAVHNLDSVPEIAAATQEVMVLQEIPYLRDSPATPGQIERSPASAPDPSANDVRMFAPGSFRDLRRYVTVNGEKIPTIRIGPGEVRRLRLIYTGQREDVRLRIERAPSSTTGPQFLTLHEIAVDGLPTGGIRAVDPGRPQPRDQVLELFPGYRSDVLLKAPAETGDYYLVDTKYDRSAPRPDTGADGSPELLRWVAKIRVEGTPVTMALPTPSSLAPHRLTDLSPAAVSGTQHAFYGLQLALSPIGYFVSRTDLSTSLTPVSTANAEPYNPSNPRVLTLGKTERWLVGSRNNGAAVTHPFHIHTNPFLITKVTSLVEPGSLGVAKDVTAREIGTPTWRDTLAMKHGYTYELLTRYDRYTGDFVDHCHILDHEDNGMMDLVRIAPATPVPGPPPVSILAPPNRISRSIPVPNGRSSVLFFVQGSACPHCMTQLTQMASKLSDQQVPVAVISASTEEDLQKFPAVPFVLVADPQMKLFKSFGVYDNAPEHATIVRGGAGEELLRRVGKEPFWDAKAIVGALGGIGDRAGTN